MTTTGTRRFGDRRPGTRPRRPGTAAPEAETIVAAAPSGSVPDAETAVMAPAPSGTAPEAETAVMAAPAPSGAAPSGAALSGTAASGTAPEAETAVLTDPDDVAGSANGVGTPSGIADSGGSPTEVVGAPAPAEHEPPAGPGPPTDAPQAATAGDPATVLLPRITVAEHVARHAPDTLPRRPDPPPPPPPLPPRWRWGAPALALLAVALLPLAAATTDLDALDGWGLATVLGPAAWAALCCAVLACVVELRSPRPRIPMLATATGVLVLCSTGMPSVVQPVARFTTSYVIAGFVDAIAGDGVPPPDVDARFFWPAFFAQWAWFRDAAGATELDVVLRWFPPVVVLVWTVGVYALARSMLGGTRAPWAAAWLFVGLNWIEQDYFSPQAEGIVLLLTVLTFALGPLATRRTDAAGVPGWPMPHPGSPRLSLPRRWLVAALTPPNRPTLPPRQLLLIYVCTSLCLVALAPEHQLTPFAIIGQLTLLAVVGRFRGRGLVVVAVVALAVYFVIGARDFWTSQIGLLLGSDEGSNTLQTGILERLAGDVGQVAVKLLRIAVPGLTWLLAIAGAWVYWRRRRDLVPIFLAVVPMAFATQGYGGEVFLRIVLYGLPVLTILGADALRTFVRQRRDREKLLTVGMLLLFPVLVLIRGGNDAYMLVTPEDMAMTRAAFAETAPGKKIVPLDDTGPYAMQGVGEYLRSDSIEGCGEDEVKTVDDVVRCTGLDDPDVILVYTSTEKKGVVLNNRAPGWSREVIDRLVASGEYSIRYQHGYDAVLLKTAPTVVGPNASQVDPGGN